MSHACSAERLRACLDTLLENAVRYTAVGDTVRIIGRVDGDNVLIGVADSGPGMDPVLAQALCRDECGHWPGSQPYTARDPKAQTGLGLALVQEATAARGGRLAAGTSAEGGALVLMVVPRLASLSRDVNVSPKARMVAPVTARTASAPSRRQSAAPGTP